ncbi:type IX secretion system outer membrane channel protein PorV [Flavobacterium gawalongense]|uniref:Type IX secretion system outer membrane channel protein PorV n=1 Tax=Flavobacterium gawalongense TaxID=2594432 RepID=A0A553BFA9_9FLAO|nr:type IX secretion system outer membrane channel protein PorV [Flavobacterium gawalongense]TRW99748.1 type IX secretion system outer membrane channel protein PorV [Flavobacterium gawalongense]TRX03865.1 type IX secretion system outer membrane channel protein PorV [Flavobacterium gawalongense]TRX06892.1 type IX secretion system outer membrane channel protein PorV [Flavobacterium gawalongense]TRX07613.1 type IX secretion system outer membrane channel protein PorV [Flavobacterium gawalongense]T
MKKITSVFICLFIISLAKAQDRVITTGVPFLLVSADARAAGMADIGVASSADAFSQQWNPAKYAFAIDKQGFSVSYTPYLTDLVNDISLGQLTYYNKLNERSAFGGSLRYFGLGEIELRETGNPDEVPRIVSPNEFTLDGSYSLKLSERFSMAVAGRYIHSSLKVATDNGDASPASSFAVDIAGFYQSEEIAYTDFNGRWRAGFNIQNLGPKISYDNDEFSNNFLPANLKVGTGFDFILDDFNKVALNLEFNKLLVPTPQNPDLNGDGTVTSEERAQNQQDYRSIGWVSGVFKSFGDAPDGFSEELKEFTYAVGAEYLYQDSFAMRLGYFHESPEKGAREFFSLGAGFKYNIVKVDVSYLFSASKVKNPLENTLRFSLTFNFGDKYDEY